MVLKGGGDDVFLPFPCPQNGRGTDGLVVRLAAAGGESKLPRITAQTGGDAAPGILQRLLGFLAEGVKAGGVSVELIHIRQHGVYGRTADFRCGCVICVYHKEPPISYYQLIK